MRTDSTRVASEAISHVRAHIKGKYGSSYLPEHARTFKSPKGAQEAHEAVRPTAMDRPPQEISGFLTRDQMRLYSLIWERFVASQMADALFLSTNATIDAGQFTFKARGSKREFDGFLKVYSEFKKKDEEERELPLMKEEEKLTLLAVEEQQNFTSPPPRYTEASLIRELEKQGIGRPSTYASIMAKIQARDYTGKEKGRFVPTPLGRKVIELLVGSFPKILDVAFTAEMEEFLDEVEMGKKEWLAVIGDFYAGFKETLELASERMKVVTDVCCPKCGKRMVLRGGRKKQYLACDAHPKCETTMDFVYGKDNVMVPLDQIKLERSCDRCGKPMVVKNSRVGPFLGCSAFPECKHTLDVELKEDGGFAVVEPKPTGMNCPKCGEEMVERRGRYGKFIACLNYPACRTTMPVPSDIPCPREGCDGRLVRRRSKRGRYFYACTSYPECDFRAKSLKDALSSTETTNNIKAADE